MFCCLFGVFYFQLTSTVSVSRLGCRWVLGEPGWTGPDLAAFAVCARETACDILQLGPAVWGWMAGSGSQQAALGGVI